ncbi:hypothetical protein BDD43_1596 [Mucilaginibacter gracilis]|uniref:Uncharacterized protein n=1 Tax=Mucilaginibacter gracilis TaxID=423350 RepID=A0A495J033_9SPHI|nr:hypothetical protein [Mucilaginibacter gracilis]RKR81449.1 hypothetical protein BDD43_1596 [Mucilaginibacter gracilis]
MPEGTSIFILKELVHPFKGQTVEKATNNNKNWIPSVLRSPTS